jgi:[ribosomal protein S18]-alanine N-acetyltransferase
VTIKVEVTQKPDADVLAAIHGECFEKGWSAGDISGMLATGAVAFVSPGAAGFGLLRPAADEAELLTLAVRRHLRGRGTGKAITEAMLDWAKGRGIKQVFLEVRQSNAAALGLYGKMGFSVMSKRKGYYNNADGTVENAIVMRCTPFTPKS